MRGPREDGEHGRGGRAHAHGGVRLDRAAMRRLAERPLDKHPPVAEQDLFEPRQFELRPHRFRFEPHTVPGAPEQTPTPDVSWGPALRGQWDWCADTQVAASSTHVVVTTRTTVGFYDRAGNPVGAPIGIDAFFSPLEMKTVLGDTMAWFDTRMVFDPYRKRFWIGALAIKYLDGEMDKHTDQRTKFACGVSVGEDPTEGFNLYWWDAVAHDGVSPDPENAFEPGDWADYPSLGIDPHCIYQTVGVQNGHLGVFNRYCLVVFFPAAALAAGTPGPIEGWQFWDLMNPDGTTPASRIQPAVHRDSPARTYFAGGTYDPGNGGILVWGLEDPLGPNQRITRSTVEVAPFGGNHDGAQKDSTHPIGMGNVGVDPLKVAVHGDQMVVSMNDAAPWDVGGGRLSACRVIQLSLANWPQVDLHRERVFGLNNVLEDEPETRFSYGWPAAELNSFGDLVVVYSRTGPTIYPEIRYSVWFAEEPDIRPSRLLKAGEAPYFTGSPGSETETIPWADVSGVSVDPDGDGVWIALCYADGRTDASGKVVSNNYSTWVGRVFGGFFPLIKKCIFAREALRPGSPVEIVVVVRNGGDAPSEEDWIHVRISLPGRREHELGRVRVPELRPGQATAVSVFGRLPEEARGEVVVEAVGLGEAARVTLPVVEP